MTEADKAAKKVFEFGAEGDYDAAVAWVIRGAQSLPEDGQPVVTDTRRASVSRVFGQLRISEARAAKLFSKDRKKRKKKK